MHAVEARRKILCTVADGHAGVSRTYEDNGSCLRASVSSGLAQSRIWVVALAEGPIRSVSLAVARMPSRDSIARRWMLAWVGAPVIGIVNGAIRRAAYENRLGELIAHQLATAAYMALITVYVRQLQRRWPIPTRRAALDIGAAWALLAVLFEFGFGHYVGKDSWEDLLEAYDLRTGHVWSLVPAWLVLAPAVVREFSVNRPTRQLRAR
jgi:hypothetical protein